MVPIRQALQIARDAELDLVEVSPNASPPVCRVIDYGKFIYERAKKEREAKKSQTKIEVKEIRLRPKTNEAHRGFKVDDARRWLLQGHKVRVTIKFRGREMDYPEIALEEKSTRDETIVHMTQVYTRFLEDAIKRHPEQWFWVHRRWKTRPEGED